MSNQDSVVDYNLQITLSKVPSSQYPHKEEVFQLKYVPPTPINLVQQGEVVVRNLYLSIDATMRIWISGVKTYMDPVKPGDLMKGMGVGEVIFTKDPKFKIGDKVLGLTYWQKYSIIKAKELTLLPSSYKDYSDFLGVLGISGLTAYFGYKKIGNLKKGEIVVVSAAAGAVGELAVQLAKAEGCTVIGIASSKQKCDYIRSIGADYTIDYKTDNLLQKMKEYCPRGFDVYFDNVGGEMLDSLLMCIRDESRVIACGSISTYNQQAGKPRYRLKNYSRIVIKRAIIQGFIFTDYVKQFPQAIAELASLIKEGKLKYRVDFVNGLEEAPKGLKNLLTGKNNGKVIVKVNSSNVGQAKL